MPPRRHRLDGPRDDLWKENETTLRRLYLKEHRTLKDVKKVMESEHGFPKTPLSTYESKLRDLGLRKKMKRKDWYPVYQHYVNSGNRHTAMYFNGTRIPWDKAWKEIRRSGARESIEGSAVALPTDVIMRTPSPALVAQNFLPLYYLPPIPWHLSDAPLVGLSPEAMFLRLRLYDIPSNLLRIEMLNKVQQPAANTLPESNELRGHYSSSDATNPMTEYTLAHQPAAISPQVSKHRGGNWDVDTLSSALYRLANAEAEYYTNPEEPLDESIDVILNQTPKYILLKMLERNSPTVRASVETLVKKASDLGRKDDFRNMIEAVARRHPEWVIGDGYLKCAARVGCFDSCRLLLQLRMQHRSKGDHHLCRCRYGFGYVDAVSEYLARGHVECVKMLYQHAIGLDPTLLQPGDITAHEIFCCILETVASGFYKRFPLDLGNLVVPQTLDWLLDAGADVDLPLPLCKWLKVLYARYTPLNWRPTTLDHMFFNNVEVYSHLVGRSTKAVTELTRPGVYLSAKKGVDSLRIYLLSRSSHTPAQQDEFVDIFLAEELLRRTETHTRTESHTILDFNVIHALLHQNVGLPEFLWNLNPSVMLYCVVRAAVVQGVHPAVQHIIKILVHKGAVIGAEVIDRAVETKGTVLLQILSSYGADFRENGASALCTAAQLDNYGAVDLLLDLGVDINATLGYPNTRERSTILTEAFGRNYVPRRHEICGHKFYDYNERPHIRSAMLEYLVSRQVYLGADSSKIIRQQFLLLVTKQIQSIDFEDELMWAQTLGNFLRLLNAELLTHDSPSTKPCLLEALFPSGFAYVQEGERTISQIIPIIELMLEYGIPTRQSGVLTHLIYKGAPRDKVQRVLDSGVDINAYSGRGLRGRYVWRYTPIQAAASIGSLGWVQFLLRMGADVNRPAKGYYGRTALQAACSGGHSNIDLIKFLIENGADVNALPSKGSLTALQAACDDGHDNIDLIRFLIENGADVNAPPSLRVAARRGDFAVVILLLENGADINAPGLSALDEAAENGKLDMVQFLLDSGAFSSYRGESGYRGAILQAESKWHWVIADIIRQHALKNGKSGEELSIPSSEWKDDSSSKYSSDLDSRDESETESEMGSNAGFEDLPPF
ncbi:hypothetical protein EKO27_g7965 [Xylaria grammica]|uniref:Clr5 domain-containing protein n=1 Tax=Xylaria grammica TaxID=363999 RepID=A0A439CYN8_9PEZI|nr:hypothetical protein EKO27_g7965 [Xylaria grammica]